jgi:hypothetical protein
LADRRIVDLDEEYVYANFQKQFVDEVIREGLQVNNRFIRLPPGAAMEKPEQHDFEFLSIPIRYKQENTCGCLFLSLASALHFVGFGITASVIATAAPQYGATCIPGIDNWTHLQTLMKQHMKFLKPITLPSRVDLLEEKSDFPTVVTLMSSEGSVQHAITIICNIIFDANCDFAMPLCKESLDYCCSTSQQQIKYHHVYQAIRFQEHANDKKQRWCKRLSKVINST